MAETNVSLQQTHHSNPTLQNLFYALDPISLILNRNSDSTDPFPLKLTSSESLVMERGPRYQAYAELRERKLRMRQRSEEERVEVEPKLTPPRKQVKFQTCSVSARKGSTSVLAQSVPDFSAAMRKENRKPVNTLPTMMEMTPPAKSWSKSNGVSPSKSRGSKSASAGEKRGGGILMARKSYANIDELKSLSSATANAINGANRGGGRNRRSMVKTGFGYRQF
ncbi:hypothetical protein L6164_007756 [Bauhinia variegata]|uniref:Uncharacterized protein n=1 Tax=Bauhinia variegata TaxID=167791 RepID=A0ACB9PEK9_BAUVA|nr:hypothetical protein L6164_007756 [Bauhinia variegata]